MQKHTKVQTESQHQIGATLKSLSLLGRLGIAMPHVGAAAGSMADSLRAGLARAKSFGATKNEGVHEPLAFEEEGRAAE